MAPTTQIPQMDDFMKMMKDFMETLMVNVKESFERSFSALQAELFEMRRIFERETFQRQQVEEDLKDLKDDVERLSQTIERMQEREDDAEQEKLNLDVVIDNLPSEKVSNKTEFFCKTVNKALMGKVIDENDVEKVEIFNNRRNPQKMTMITTLKRAMEKKEIMRQKKLFRPNNLFVKENLTKKRYQLLKFTREFAQKKSIKFVWTRDGKIFLRETESSAAIWVRSRAQLSKFD